MEVITIGWGCERRWTGWFAIPTASILIGDYYVQYNHFMSASDKEPVTVSVVITVQTLREYGEIKNPHKAR